MKPVEFVGDSLAALSKFPPPMRREAGFQLNLVQHGLDPEDWKPMNSIGAGVREIRIRDEHGAFRVIYVVREDVEVVMTDDFVSYPKAMMEAVIHGRKHETINHTSGVYVDGDYHHERH